MMTALRSATFENLQLNAGVFLVGFDANQYEDADALENAVLAALDDESKILGATVGGGTFVAEQNLREIEADGARDPFVKSTVNDGTICRLTTTMKEITPDNFARSLGSCEIDATAEHKTVLKIKNDIEPAHYIPRLSWVGDTSSGYVLIELDNALNIAGTTLTFTDKGEGSIPVDFRAHRNNATDRKYAPCRIFFFDRPAA